MTVLNDIEKAKEKRELAKALRSLLETSRDFKLVFKDYYLKEYALDLLYDKSNDINTPLIDKKLEAVSFFNNFIEEVLNSGDIADEDIREGYLQLQADEDI